MSKIFTLNMSAWLPDQCPDRAKHTTRPAAYLAWHEWVEQKSRTHRSTKCGTCGLYAIWVPRTRSDDSDG